MSVPCENDMTVFSNTLLSGSFTWQVNLTVPCPQDGTANTWDYLQYAGTLTVSAFPNNNAPAKVLTVDLTPVTPLRNAQTSATVTGSDGATLPRFPLPGAPRRGADVALSRTIRTGRHGQPQSRGPQAHRVQYPRERHQHLRHATQFDPRQYPVGPPRFPYGRRGSPAGHRRWHTETAADRPVRWEGGW